MYSPKAPLGTLTRCCAGPYLPSPNEQPVPIENDVTVAEKRGYSVKSTEDAKQIAAAWLEAADLGNAVSFGLPEVDDRYHVWRVPLLNAAAEAHGVGEVVINAQNSLILEGKSTEPSVLEARLLNRAEPPPAKRKKRQKRRNYELSTLRNTIALGDSAEVLEDLPAESVDLVFTSPPYYNARVEYSEYVTYEDYLCKIKRVITACHRVLSEGRFFVMNVSPVLIRRKSRNEASRRIAVPFDMHRLLTEAGFDFIDDIIWEKPEGAGWATGRGRRFSADRNPLQYKAVPVTENVLVYRKRTKRLIDWNIRAHPEPQLVEASKVEDGYERTNIWRIAPSRDKRHPAIFPLELAERVVTYYSFKRDVVLDPFAGIGTTGKAAYKLDRRFVLVEKDPSYFQHLRGEVKGWLGKQAEDVFTINTPPLQSNALF